MAVNAYLMIKGQKQGAINGPVTVKQHENSILIHAFDNQVTSPRDPTTGQASGKRQHQPVMILKDVDTTSPQLWTALVTNETLTSWVLGFWMTTAAGVEMLSYTVTLTNASIVSIDEFMADNLLPANVGLPLREQITFTYQKIQWTWTEGAITATDDWTAGA